VARACSTRSDRAGIEPTVPRALAILIGNAIAAPTATTAIGTISNFECATNLRSFCMN
jgi:hypothetical protein